MENAKYNLNRYARQMQYPAIGEAGQQALANSRVLLVGCGALGCALANTLVRAGIGKLRILDRDWVELSNLQRQSLFTEADSISRRPKAIAAKERLEQINSDVLHALRTVGPCPATARFRKPKVA